MCELLGMSANTPTDLCFSFTELTRRGGDTGPHKDGWGVAFYEGLGVQTFHESRASAQSDIAHMVRSLPIKSEIAICHIRQANVGEVNLANTHPFQREMWGRYWTFAHNGQIDHFNPRPGNYEPVGSTDSEALFCDLMNAIRGNLHRDVDLQTLTAFLVSQSEEYRKLGVFNLLLTNGEWLFTYCTTKMASFTKRSQFGPERMADEDVTVDFGQENTPGDVISVIVTEPLTSDKRWEIYEPNEWRLWQNGEVVASGKPDKATSG